MESLNASGYFSNFRKIWMAVFKRIEFSGSGKNGTQLKKLYLVVCDKFIITNVGKTKLNYL